ncbi:MAG: hypothetical protein DHS80DRAFT_7323, partial [Piptocephalis tieghemiana]
KVLRLILRGRIIQDVQVLFSLPISSEQGVEDTLTIHCIPSARPSSLDSQDSQPSPSDHIIPVSGFDRLREAGLSEEDIAQLRQDFHRVRRIPRVPAGMLGPEGDPNDPDQVARRLEDEWMDNPATEATLSDG